MATQKLKRRSRPLRVERSDCLHFVTCRTIEERFFLHPLLTCAAKPPNRRAARACASLGRRCDKRYERLARKANERRGKMRAPMTAERVKRIAKGLIGSALARAQANTGVEIFAFVGMSNHVHIVVRCPNRNFSAFARDFKSIVTKGINRISGRTGPMWARRADCQATLDDEAAAGRVVYTLNNPRKAKLVDDPETWPGLNLAFGLSDSDDIEFEYLDLDAWYKNGRPQDIDDFFATARLKLSPLPAMEHMERGQYAAQMRRWVAEAAKEAANSAPQRGRSRSDAQAVLGIEKVLAAAFDARPKHAKFSKRPYCFGSAELRRAHYLEMSELIAAYEDASDRYRAGNVGVVFPEGTYPPPLISPALAA